LDDCPVLTFSSRAIRKARKRYIFLTAAREPVAAAPDTPEKLGTAAKGDGKNQADTKKDAKEKSAPHSRTSARVWSHRYYNYYPGRH
jgi:hypothetical protein